MRISEFGRAKWGRSGQGQSGISEGICHILILFPHITEPHYSGPVLTLCKGPAVTPQAQIIAKY